MNTVSKPKKLLVCLLAAAMGASALAGGMLLNANAEAVDLQVKSEDLFTVSEGVNVLSESQYELKSEVGGQPAGTKVGDTGLRFQSQNDEAFTIELNGIFHRSFGLDWAAPADGFLSGTTADTLAEVVFEIAEYGNPDNKFEIHYAGYWQSSAWVEYDYTNKEGETETLYRTYGLAYQDTSRMVYSKEIIDAAIASPYGSDLMFSPVLTANGEVTNRRYSRTELRVQNSLTDATAGSTAADGSIINVVGWSNGGGAVPIASFRDEPETFTPTDEDMEVYAAKQWWDPSNDVNCEIGHNLPRINFDNGYTVKIHVSAGLEFMAFSIGEIMDNDSNNYWTNEPFNTWPAMQVNTTGAQAYCNDESNASTYWNSVSFYQRWKTAPFINIPKYDSVVAAGEAITPPAATYSTNGDPEATNPVTNVEYRVNNGDWTTVADNAIPAAEAGDEVYVRYSVPYNDTTITETIQLSVRTMPAEAFSAENVVRVYDPSVQVTPNRKATSNNGETQSSEAGLLLESGIEQSYAFDLVGRFTGNTEIRWGTAADNGWDVNGRVEFIIAEAGNPENYFKVIWLSPHQSRAYVEYTYNGQTLYCAQGRNNSGKYFYVLGDGTTDSPDEMISDNYDVIYQPHLGAASFSGILGLEWNGDVLNVMATNESGNKQILASFVNDHEGFTLPEGATGTKSNLPKISFESGYTVSVKVTGSIDFALYGLTTAEDTTSFNTETLSYEPLWYTDGTNMPVFEDLPEISGVQFDGGAQVTVPDISYTAASDAELKVEWIKPDESATTVNVNDSLTMTDKGDHILRYTVTVDGVAYTRELVVHVCDYTNFISGTKATCTEAGEGFFTCEHGNLTQKEIPVDPTAHSVVHHAEVPATCTEDGTMEHWECQYCHKNFSDEDCTEELDDLTIPAGHTIAAVPKKDATCTEDGYEAHYRCSVCGNLFSDEAGNTEISLEDVTIPATGHSYGEPEWTWTEFTGATAKFTCSACDDEQTVTATITSEVTTPATCEADGVRTYTATATFGEQQYTDKKTEAIPATGHSYGEPAWTWTAFSGATAKFTCANCGDEQEVTATITNEVTTPATCEADGVRTYTATATFGEQQYTDTKTEAIAATGHHMVQVPAKAPTCTEDGNSAYYKCSECGRCSSDDQGEMEIDESSMILKATGHSYEEGICTVCGAEDPDYAPETGLTGGEIAGITIACVAVAGGGAALAIVLIRKRKFKK